MSSASQQKPFVVFTFFVAIYMCCSQLYSCANFPSDNSGSPSTVPSPKPKSNPSPNSVLPKPILAVLGANIADFVVRSFLRR